MHPCMNCGACCATYRVAFHWMETIHGPVGPGVPEALTQPLDAHRLVMAGTKRAVLVDGKAREIGYASMYELRGLLCDLSRGVSLDGNDPRAGRPRCARGPDPAARCASPGHGRNEVIAGALCGPDRSCRRLHNVPYLRPPAERVS